MRILHVSDIHGSTTYIPRLRRVAIENRASLIIASGDFETPEAVDMLAEVGLPVYAVTGNMDPPRIRTLLEEYGFLIDGMAVEHQGFIVAGIGGRSVFATAASLLNTLGEAENLLLVTHYPPKNTEVDKTYGGEHIGKDVINHVIERLKPRIVLCGHVHEARGVDRIGESLIVNPGPLMHGYYAVVDTSKAEALLARF